MSYKHHWANPAITSGWQNYPNGFVYSAGLGMPTARLGFYGTRPIRVHSFGDYYVTGPGSFMRMNYGGSLLDSGGVAVFGGSGGTFQWEAHQGNTGERMYFGRDPACCSTISANDGFTWAGLLAGSFWWDQVPNGPAINASASGNDITLSLNEADNGGVAVSSHSWRMRVNGGGWQAQNDGYPNGNIRLNDMAPGTYEFQAWSWNAVGPSQIAQSAPVVVRSGGKRLSGSGYVNASISRRLTSTGYKDTTIAKRLAASGWIDLTS